MSDSRKVGIMVDSKNIESNITHMSDAIRNANFKVLEAQGVKENDDGEYLDAEGENLLMEEGVVKALLQDAIDSYLVASLPGRDKGDPNEFSYYLWDSFPNVAEYIQAEPRISSYVSSLFANTCGMLINSLAPALQDIAAHGQSLSEIETFHQGPSTSYYLLVGEEADQVLDDDPDHILLRMSPEQRREQTKINLIKELGVEGYDNYIRKQQQLRDQENLPPEVIASLNDYDQQLKQAIGQGQPFHPHISHPPYLNVDTSVVDNVIKPSPLTITKKDVGITHEPATFF
ncbi:hypothetical protein PHABIO_64 [Pseudomonas phage Phabio]|uniref:Uncharacterized protein n=1 Tax=Pseudomonas phage Phabio TaxID=2006668 RepID=A0A1Y0SW36_9CAUD|nr:hypothetical protein MZD05_gp064 [Pseudomonas phage Phabio]ARV76695.1 hypothetical protein PHABIO_64 [Pseudomonas phage Phabio]